VHAEYIFSPVWLICSTFPKVKARRIRARTSGISCIDQKLHLAIHICFEIYYKHASRLLTANNGRHDDITKKRKTSLALGMKTNLIPNLQEIMQP
jgi:hypothetical protein